jgi:hypothetical protein
MLDETELNTIYHNLLLDLRKKDIDMITKGRIVEEYSQLNKISINEVGIQLGIPKTTVHTWHRFHELGQDSYDKLIESGFKPSDIQKAMKNSSSSVIKAQVNRKRIDIILEDARTRLQEFIHKREYSDKTEIMIKDLQNVLNRILMRVNNDN